MPCREIPGGAIDARAPAEACFRKVRLDECPAESFRLLESVPLEAAPLMLQNIDQDNNTVNLVIRSETDYRKFVTSDGELPPVDFSEYILLCGQIKYPHCVELLKTEVIDKCGKVEHQTYVFERTCFTPETISYFTLVPVSDTNEKDIRFTEIEVRITNGV